MRIFDCMKHLILIIWVILPVLTRAQTPAQIDFANRFMQAVTDHNQEAVIKMTEPGYRKTQIAFLGGRKTQFVNELFGGTDLHTSEFVNTKFAEILKIEIAEVVGMENGNFEYIFRIRDGRHDILVNLIYVPGKKGGFVGAVG